MIPSNRSRCSEYLRSAARAVDAGDVSAAAESIRVALLLMWGDDRTRLFARGDSLLTVTPESLTRWAEERAT